MQPYFDIKTLLKTKDLPLTIKTLAHGFLHGIHASQQRGVGIEFSQFRAYEPGDELSKIDWKLFARSDKYFVREAERESDVNVWLVIDCSHSMAQQSAKATTKQVSSESHTHLENIGQLNKLDYGRYLAATIAYLAQKQGDSVGLLTLNSNESIFLPAMAGERHWQKLLLALTQINAGGTVPGIETMTQYLSSVRKNALVIVISDFHQSNNELTAITSQLSNRHTDVVTFHLDSHDEINFSYRGAIKFQDLESGQQLQVSAEQVKAGYLQNKANTTAQLKHRLSGQKISYFHANIDKPLDEALSNFLNTRAKVRW